MKQTLLLVAILLFAAQTGLAQDLPADMAEVGETAETVG